MPNEPAVKELAALDALIAASLVGRSVDELSDEELLELSESYPKLSETGRALFESLGTEPFKSRAKIQDEPDETIRREEFAGMYRQGSDEGLEPEVKEEMERKRKELRARLRARGKKDV